MGYPIKQSQTAQPLMFILVDSTDHITGLTGLSPTVTLSKNGGAFASPAGTVSEVGNGLYKVAPNATDAGTLGPLALHAIGAGADPVDEMFHVVAFDPQSAANLGLSSLPTATAGASGGLPTGDGLGRVTLAGVTHTGAVIPTVTTLTGHTPQTGDSFARIGAAGAGLTAVPYTGPTVASVADAVWDEAQAGHTTAGTFGAYLDASVSGVSTGGVSADDIATAVWSATTRAITDKTGFSLAGTQTFSNTGTWTGDLAGSVGSITSTVNANVTQWSGSAVATPDTAGYPKVTVKSGTGTGEISLAAGAVTVGTLSATGKTDVQIAMTNQGYTTALATVIPVVNSNVAAILADTRTNGVKLAAGSIATATFAAGATLPRVTLVDTCTVNSDKSGYALSAAGLDVIAVESGVNARQALSPILAAAAGVLSGAATSTVTLKNPAGTATRAVATVDADGNRSAITLTLPT